LQPRNMCTTEESSRSCHGEGHVRRVLFRSAAGIRFLGVLFPPRDSASLAVGLPPRLSGCDGPDGVSTFRTHEIRPGRVPPVPREQRYPHDRRTVLGRRLPILNGSLLIIPASTTRRGELP
jgi:hypothetical protein